MKSNVIAAVAGGLVLGGAIFLPMGANAINQEIKQVSASQEKVAAPSTETSSDELQVGSDNAAQTAGLDPIASTDPIAGTTPVAVTGPTFSSDDDDEDTNDDDSYGEDSEDGESDD